MKRENLEFTVRHFPEWLPPDPRWLHYEFLPSFLYDLAQGSDIVSEPRKLVQTQSGLWIYEIALGTGELHSVLDVVPHGGEPVWYGGSTEYAMFLKYHPWLLDGRTVHLLFGGPDEVAINTDDWVISEDGLGGVPLIQMGRSFTRHYRNADPRKNDAWSYPARYGNFQFNDPTPGARAGMMLMEEIARIGELMIWIGGHNQQVAAGTQFQQSGPHAALSCARAESLAGDLGVTLDLGPPDGPHMRRHAGTVASFEADCAAIIHSCYEGVQAGNTAFDWGREHLFPNLSTHSTEVPLLHPDWLGEWDAVWDEPDRLTWDFVSRSAARQTGELRRHLERAMELTEQLPPLDPYVEAAHGLMAGASAWGVRRNPRYEPDEVLHPHDAFRWACAEPLYLARAAAPVAEALIRHEMTIRRWISPDALNAAMNLQIAMEEVVEDWRPHLVYFPLRKAYAMQVLAAETATYGCQGIHLSV